MLLINFIMVLFICFFWGVNLVCCSKIKKKKRRTKRRAHRHNPTETYETETEIAEDSESEEESSHPRRAKKKTKRSPQHPPKKSRFKVYNENLKTGEIMYEPKMASAAPTQQTNTQTQTTKQNLNQSRTFQNIPEQSRTHEATTTFKNPFSTVSDEPNKNQSNAQTQDNQTCKNTASQDIQGGWSWSQDGGRSKTINRTTSRAAATTISRVKDPTQAPTRSRTEK